MALALALAGCTPPVLAPRAGLPFEIQAIVTEFQELSGLSSEEMNQLDIVLGGAMPEKTVGLCFPGPRPRVVLSFPYWEYGPEDLPLFTLHEYRRMVLFHEMGHCLLKREHAPLDMTLRVPDGSVVPVSIMVPWTSPELVQAFIDHQQWYTWELMNGYEHPELFSPESESEARTSSHLNDP
jgi:hypothetical protein